MFEICAPYVLKFLLNWTFCHKKSQLGVAYSVLKIFCTFPTFSLLCLAYADLKILENWQKQHNFFRVKDKLAVLL